MIGQVDGGSAASAPCNVVIFRPLFIRGEVNNDGRRDIADAVYLLNYFFRAGPRPTCLDAADANDDGRNDISDAIWLVSWQFQGAAEPRAPFPACGKDPTRDDLDCRSFPACP